MPLTVASSELRRMAQYGGLFALGVTVAIVIAFWQSYFSRLVGGVDPLVHAHAATQSAWCLTILAQAFLIRAGSAEAHRRIGRLSVFLVALIVLTTLMLMRRGLQGITLDPVIVTNAGFNLVTLLAFVVIYALAMRYRRAPQTHGLLMCATLLPAFTAFGGRLIEASPELASLCVRIFGASAALNQAALLPADAIAMALSVLEWRRNRSSIFLGVLAVLLAIHLSPALFGMLPGWAAAVRWFVR